MLLLAAQREQGSPDAVGEDGVAGSFKALDAQASFDRVLFDGGEFGTGADVGSEEELDFLGLPGLLDADQVRTLLKQRQADQVGRGRRPSASAETPVVDHRRLAELRKELNALVGAWARRSGQPHGSVHTELRRRCGGPEVATASVDQLEARTEMVRGWFVGRR
jgi:hypothetical protein